MFKVGDRVICSGEVDDLDISDRIGTIIHISSGEISFKIKFDERFDGRLHGEDGMCWNVNKRNIKHYISKTLEGLMLD